MTSEEILKLLLNKFERFEKRLDEVVVEVKELRSDVNRLEAKVDANYKELSEKIDTNYKELSEKIDANYKELSGRIDTNYKELLWRMKELSVKMDDNYRELSGKIKKLSVKVDDNHKESLDKVMIVRIAIVDIDNTIDTLIKEFKANRQFTQGAIHDMQVRLLHLENEFSNAKLKLDSLDRAS